MRVISVVLLCVLAVAAAPLDSFAQEFLPSEVLKEFVADQSRLWQAPLKVKRKDAKWLGPLAAGTLALLATDRSISQGLRIEDLRRPSRYLAKAGAAGPLLTVSTGLLLSGKIAGDSTALNAGQRSLKALIHTELVVRGLKVITNRERPNKANGLGQFWGGGRSFPSAHAADTWAFATVIAHEYKDKRLIGIAAYSLASLVTVSRISGQHHFPSDTLIGASIGRLIGKYIVRK